MFETHADYKEFVPLAQKALEEKGRYNLANLLEQPKVRKLFLHDVDHPMGYQDGPSGISTKRMERRALPLTEKDRHKLYEIAEYSIREVENTSAEYSPQERRALLIGANQLIQNARWNTRFGPRTWNNGGKGQLERIAKAYTENVGNIKNVKEWDAQITENKGFYHSGKGLDFSSMLMGMFGSVPAMLGAAALFGQDVVENVYMPLIAFGGFSLIAGNYVLVPLQDIAGEEKSPNISNKLITSRQYKFLRHPLYSVRMLSDIIFGSTSFPFGTFFSARSLYHNAKGCEKQDERMRILHGEEAINYQRRTPAMIPGTKLLMKGLRKILPKKVCDALDTPVSHYLERLPKIKDENYYTDNRVTHPGYHKGEPTYHLGTPLERRALPNEFQQMGRDFAEAGRGVYKLGEYVAGKIKRRIGKSQRRKNYLENLERNKEVAQTLDRRVVVSDK